MSGHEFEPVRGLPEALPPGETLLWQGRPLAWPLARRTFYVGQLMAYFLLLLIWQIAAIPAGDGFLGSAAVSVLWVTGLALTAIGVLALLATLMSRSTVYTITSRRLVIRFGIALPVTINLPFPAIEAAWVKLYADGSGDIPLSLAGAERVSFFLLWPHVRSWRISRAEPMLRYVPEAGAAAQILARALADASAVPASPMIEPDEGAVTVDNIQLPARAAA